MLKYTRLAVTVGDSPLVFDASSCDDFFDAKRHLTLLFVGDEGVGFPGNG